MAGVPVHSATGITAIPLVHIDSEKNMARFYKIDVTYSPPCSANGPSSANGDASAGEGRYQHALWHCQRGGDCSRSAVVDQTAAWVPSWPRANGKFRRVDQLAVGAAGPPFVTTNRPARPSSGLPVNFVACGNDWISAGGSVFSTMITC
jgi:hypothetical protein